MTTNPNEEPNHLNLEFEFGAQLDALVRHHIGNLTATNAVDEANGDVLDALIDSAVGDQQERIDARAIRRREALRRQQSSLTSEQVVAAATEDESLGRVRAVATQILSLRARVAGADTSDVADSSGTYSAFEVQRLRDFAAQRRTALERDSHESLKAVRTRSSSRLLVRRDAANRGAEATKRRLQGRIERHDAAVSELDIALAMFRGQPTGQPSSPIPTAAEEATRDAA